MARQKRKCQTWFWVIFAMILATATATATATDLTLSATMAISQPDDYHSLFLRRSMTVGSSCSEEGQWYCMESSFQRCASGQWSAVMQCAAGTQCSPSGQSYEFHVDFWNGGASSSSSSGTSTSAATRASIPGTSFLTSSPGLLAALLGGSWWTLGLVVTMIIVLLA